MGHQRAMLGVVPPQLYAPRWNTFDSCVSSLPLHRGPSLSEFLLDKARATNSP